MSDVLWSFQEIHSIVGERAKTENKNCRYEKALEERISAMS